MNRSTGIQGGATAVALLAMLSTGAFAQPFALVHVSPTGSDANDGSTAGNPKLTLNGANGALSVVAIGGQILLAPGAYHTSTDIDLNGAVTITGPMAGVDPRPSAPISSSRTQSPLPADPDPGPGEAILVLDAANTEINLNASDIVIEGLWIRRGTSDVDTIVSADSAVLKSGFVFRNNVLTGDGVGDDAMELHSLDGALIEQNYIFDWPTTAIKVRGVAGPSVNCVVQNNEITNVDLSSTSAGAIYMIEQSENTLVAGNRIHGVLGTNAISFGNGTGENSTQTSVTGGVALGNIIDNCRGGIQVIRANTLVKGNTISNIFDGGSGMSPIWVRTSTGAPTLFDIPNIRIIENTITNNAQDAASAGGTRISANFAGQATLQISCNSYTFTTPAAINNNSAVSVNAQGNFFGGGDPPVGAQALPTTQQTSVVGPVDTSNFLTSAVSPTEATFSAPGLDYGLILPDTTSDLTIDLTNDGTCSDLVIDSPGLDFSGPGAAFFAFTPPGPSFPITLTPGNSTTFSIRYTPGSDPGPHNAVATLTATDSVEPFNASFTLSGASGVPPPPLPIVYVSPSGDDNNPGDTPENAKLTLNGIRGALSAVESGGQIFMAAGTYSTEDDINIDLPVTINGPQAGVDPRPSPPIVSPRTQDPTFGNPNPGPDEAVIVFAGVESDMNINSGDVVLDGLWIRRSAGGADTVNSPDSATLKAGVVFRNNVLTGDNFGGDAMNLHSLDGGIIERNYIFDWPTTAIKIRGVAGPSANCIVRDNEITNVRISSTSTGAVYMIEQSVNTMVVGNFIYGLTGTNAISFGNATGENTTQSSVTGGVALGNVIDDCRGGIQVLRANTTVQGNRISGIFDGGSGMSPTWVRISSGAPALNDLSNVRIFDNVIVNNEQTAASAGGTRISSSFTGHATLSITCNSYTFTTPGAINNNSATTVNAPANYFGGDNPTTGTQTLPATQQTNIVGPVDVTGYLTDPPVLQDAAFAEAGLTFGLIPENDTQDLTIDLTNNGNCGDLVIESPGLTFTGTDAALFDFTPSGPTFPLVLSPGETATLSVRYSPSGNIGTHSALATLTTFDSVAPFYASFQLNGTAGPEPTPSPSPSPTISPSPSPSISPSATPSPSPSLTLTPSPSISPSPSLTPSPSPSETATPTPSPTATPTATASPSASPTQSPSPTESPSPTVSPSPTATPVITVDFPFNDDSQGWQFFNPAIFSPVAGTYSNSGTSLDTTVSENTNSFAYWESPEFVIGVPEASERGAVPIDGLIGPGSLYSSTFTVKSSLADTTLVPTVRLRSSAFNFEQSDVVILTSAGNGNLSPTIGGRDYAQFFSQPTGVGSFRLDFDVLNFDPLDAANATLSLDRVVVNSLGVPQIDGELVGSLDFVANGALGFTARDATPLLARPAVFDSSNGLLIRAFAPTRVELPPSTVFGFWGAETSVPVVSDRLYGITFKVNSDATAIQRAHVPTFRMRVNDSSLKYSAYVNIDSRDQATRVPVDGVAETYTLWAVMPAEIDGGTLIFSFDYLLVPDSDDDGNIALILEEITVNSFPLN
jgi:hypothetical protein